MVSTAAHPHNQSHLHSDILRSHQNYSFNFRSVNQKKRREKDISQLEQAQQKAVEVARDWSTHLMRKGWGWGLFWLGSETALGAPRSRPQLSVERSSRRGSQALHNSVGWEDKIQQAHREIREV